MKSLKIAAAVLCGVAVLGIWLAPWAEGASKDADPSSILSKVTIVHFRGAPAKPSKPGGGGKPQAGYYTYIANGARWRLFEDVALNPANRSGIPEYVVYDAVVRSLVEWETYGGQIFGDLTVNPAATYNDKATDGVNSVSFGDLGDSNIIAITTVWGYFYGAPKTRQIVETDLLFNEFYLWGDAAANPSLMDLLNIAVHEVGHCAGMGDLYEPAAGDETMFGYSSEGETKKRDLYIGDKIGISKLYQ